MYNVYTGLSPFSRSRPTCLPPTRVYIYTCIYYTYLIYISWVLKQIRSCVLTIETEPAVKPGDFGESIFTNESVLTKNGHNIELDIFFEMLMTLAFVNHVLLGGYD